ncbi:hypothetical protein [Streptomyces zaomyceticus]|uniref:hypothetical protein n=1 Tax=Streptomyces zaomyceticus TaxID=68286 RepID=UPI0037A3B8C8
MTDRDNPDYSSLKGGEEESAEEAIQELVNWYNIQLLAEHRAPIQNEGLVAVLKAERAAALADQAQLATAGPAEAARIASFYAARLKELRQS